jgi:hypothetical protein
MSFVLPRAARALRFPTGKFGRRPAVPKPAESHVAAKEREPAKSEKPAVRPPLPSYDDEAATLAVRREELVPTTPKIPSAKSAERPTPTPTTIPRVRQHTRRLPPLPNFNFRRVPSAPDSSGVQPVQHSHPTSIAVVTMPCACGGRSRAEERSPLTIIACVIIAVVMAALSYRIVPSLLNAGQDATNVLER